MKQALVVGAVVAGYSLVEAVVLLSVLLPGPHQGFAEWAQLFIIPSGAVLMSFLANGSDRWSQRALLILVGFLGAPVFVTLLLTAGALLDGVAIVSRALFFTLLALVLGAFFFALYVCIRAIRRKTIRLNTASRMAELQAGVLPLELQWRKRGALAASWIPSTTVLIVFLFLFQLWGIFTHIAKPSSGKLPGYNVPTPATWIVLDVEPQRGNGESWVTGLAFESTPATIKSFATGNAPLADWNFGTDPYGLTDVLRSRRHIPRDDEINGQRFFNVGGEVLTCREYWPSYLFRPERAEPALAFTSCSGKGRFYANFYGQRSSLPTFYSMLNSIKATRG